MCALNLFITVSALSHPVPHKDFPLSFATTLDHASTRRALSRHFGPLILSFCASALPQHPANGTNMGTGNTEGDRRRGLY